MSRCDISPLVEKGLLLCRRWIFKLKLLLISIIGCETLLSEIFARRKFGGSQKPRNFCIFPELNFAVHVLEQISREFNFMVNENLDSPRKFRFRLIKNNFIK